MNECHTLYIDKSQTAYFKNDYLFGDVWVILQNIIQNKNYIILY